MSENDSESEPQNIKSSTVKIAEFFSIAIYLAETLGEKIENKEVNKNEANQYIQQSIKALYPGLKVYRKQKNTHVKPEPIDNDIKGLVDAVELQENH